MEIFRHVNSSVASYTSYIHISLVPLFTTHVLVILLSKSIIEHVNLTSLIHNNSLHQIPYNTLSSLHPRFQWSSSSRNFNDRFLNKYSTNPPVSLVPNLRCHKLYVCKLWWLKYGYFQHKSMGEISVPLPVAFPDEDYCSSFHQSTGGVIYWRQFAIYCWDTVKSYDVRCTCL